MQMIFTEKYERRKLKSHSRFFTEPIYPHFCSFLKFKNNTSCIFLFYQRKAISEIFVLIEDMQMGSDILLYLQNK